MPKKILIIEDEGFLAEMYQIKFQKEGYEVVTASDGLEGIKKAKTEKPDLVLLDLVMPEMDGYTVLKKLRDDEKTKNLIIYIFSNLAQREEIQKGIKEGANGYLLKANLTPTQLMDKISEVFCGKNNNAKNNQIKKQSGKNENKKTEKKEHNKTILLIEDEEAIIDMYKIRLEKVGYNVEIAKNGAWGVKRAKETKPNLIILDMVMPAMTGYQAMKKLKSDEKTKNIPIIVLSNSAQDKDIEKARKCGAECYLLKSQITPAKLSREIEKLINK